MPVDEGLFVILPLGALALSRINEKPPASFSASLSKTAYYFFVGYTVSSLRSNMFPKRSNFPFYLWVPRHVV